MRNLFMAFLLVGVLASCANEKTDDGNPFVTFKNDPNPENYQALIQGLMTTIRNDSTADESKLEALNQGYEASMQMNQTSQAIGFLNTYVRENKGADDNPDKIIQLAHLLKKAGKEEVALTLAQGFLISHPNHPKADEARAMVSDEDLPVVQRIQQIGGGMFNVEEGQLDEDVARRFVDVCEAYALSAPDQPEVPDFLHKAAETARTMRTLPKALSLYDWILEDYQGHPKAPQALFLKAFTYDNNLNDTANARKYYQAFLEKYPDDEFADDTQFLLENLGKSDEEMLEALTKKKK